MTLLLAGDIGGTKTILRLVESEGKSFKTLAQHTYKSGAYPDLVPMVQEFFAQQQQEIPAIACFAIAGPVVNQSAKLTNLSWFLEEKRLEKELGITKVSLINDFAAVSYGILGLTEADLFTLQSGVAQPQAPIAIIGAGTGLGEAFLIPQDSGYEVFSSEGGHTDFAPTTELEIQLLQYLQHQFNLDHVSTERVVSGPGVVSIYQFLQQQNFAPESPAISAIRKENPQVDLAAIISQAAQEEKDPLALKAMELFFSTYGAETGNLALKLLPYGGIYLAGGIAAKNIPLISSGGFMQAFKNKGRVSPLLENIPVYVILDPLVGVLGSVLYALKD